VSALGTSLPALAESLENWLRGTDDSRVVGAASEAGRAPPRVAFLFPGQGPQYAGMGREPRHGAGVPRRVRRVRERARACARPSALPIVFLADGDSKHLHQTANAQPAMFAIEYALATLWRSWGLEPAAVMGHSSANTPRAWPASSRSTMRRAWSWPEETSQRAPR
jgi:acyl transferase domain-containing protein